MIAFNDSIMLILDPKCRNELAIKEKNSFGSGNRILRGIEDLKSCAPYFGWVRMGQRDLYMYLNGKDDGVALRWFWMNTFETTSITIWERLSKFFLFIIDVGAHTGCYSMIASKFNQKATVLAIEPMPVNLSRLSVNREYNMLKNLIVIPGAAYSSDSVLSMNLYSNYDYCFSGGSVIKLSKSHSNVSSLSSVRGIMLNNISKTFSRKSLIKIDTEGTEYEVIVGAEDFIRSRSWLLCESTNDNSSRMLDDYFEQFNYSFFLIDDEKGKIVPVESLSPIRDGGKLCMAKLNRLIVPSEELSFLKANILR